VNRLIVTSLALLCWVESPALAVEPDGDLKEELREVREQLAKLQAAQDARDQQEAAQHETPTGAVVILSGETQEEASPSGTICMCTGPSPGRPSP
jgi:hypothetical protein